MIDLLLKFVLKKQNNPDRFFRSIKCIATDMFLPGKSLRCATARAVSATAHGRGSSRLYRTRARKGLSVSNNGRFS